MLEPSESFSSVQLEKEIAAKEHASRNPPEELSGNIAGMGGPSRPRPMQDVSLDGDLDTIDEPVLDTVVCSFSICPFFFLKFGGEDIRDAVVHRLKVR